MKSIYKLPTQVTIEAEVANGLEDIAAEEINSLLGSTYIHNLQIQSGQIRFNYTGNLRSVLELRTVIAVYHLRYYDIPRPKALLGHQHFQQVLRDIELAFKLSDEVQFESIYISAAGADSSVMIRIKEELAAHTRLTAGTSSGDLWLRVRRAGKGWEVLTRLTSRPLVTRRWRLCNMEGALNAAVANAMIRLVQPQPNELLVNMMCGTGTLLIEAAETVPRLKTLGCDLQETVLKCARQNVEAVNLINRIEFVLADAQSVPMPAQIADIICADLPFGQLVGSHSENQVLYPHFLREAWRLARHGARCVLITHEVRLIESLFAKDTLWQVTQVRKIDLRGLHPRIYLLTKP